MSSYAISKPKRFPHRSFLKIFIALAVVITLIAAASAWASTGYPGEIYNIAVENVTPTSVDIVWDTIHLSTSQVVLARDTNYQGERRITAAIPGWSIITG